MQVGGNFQDGFRESIRVENLQFHRIQKEKKLVRITLEVIHSTSTQNNWSEIESQLLFLPNLVHLDLPRNNFQENIPLEIDALSKLTHLDLSNNNLQESISLEIDTLSRLTHLHLSYNNLKGELPLSLTNLTQLVRFDISFNQINMVSSLKE
jgi:Leucine-rich repeat (LRR) protein